jgi:hypothetical protein
MGDGLLFEFPSIVAAVEWRGSDPKDDDVWIGLRLVKSGLRIASSNRASLACDRRLI